MADFARSDDPAVQAQLDRLGALSPGRDVLGLDCGQAAVEGFHHQGFALVGVGVDQQDGVDACVGFLGRLFFAQGFFHVGQQRGQTGSLF